MNKLEQAARQALEESIPVSIPKKNSLKGSVSLTED